VTAVIKDGETSGFDRASPVAGAAGVHPTLAGGPPPKSSVEEAAMTVAALADLRELARI
jgi:hypothetical protein